MTDHDAAELFEPRYSPRRVRFLLVHFEELVTLADSPKTSAHIAEHLAREWMLLQDRPGQSCLCQMTESEPACAHSPSAGGRSGSGHSASMMIADLVTAARGLPRGWQVAASIRAAICGERLDPKTFAALDGRPTYQDAMEHCARTLGWRPGAVDVVAVA